MFSREISDSTANDVVIIMATQNTRSNIRYFLALAQYCFLIMDARNVTVCPDRQPLDISCSHRVDVDKSSPEDVVIACTGSPPITPKTRYNFARACEHTAHIRVVVDFYLYFKSKKKYIYRQTTC